MTGSVSHTWSGRSDGASFWRARIAVARRMFAAVSSSAAPSMSRSIMLASYRSTTERYASVREAWFLHATASSELATPPNEMMTSPPRSRTRAMRRSRSSSLAAPSRSYCVPHVGVHGLRRSGTTKPSTVVGAGPVVGVLERVRRLEGHVRVGREPGAGRSGGDALDGAVRPLPAHEAERDEADDDRQDDQDAERREPSSRRGAHEGTTESELGWISIR